jgi:hypothetical protein
MHRTYSFSEGYAKPRIAAIKRCHKVDPFDIASFRVVIMPTNMVILIGVRLLVDAVINDHHALYRKVSYSVIFRNKFP